MTQVNRIPDMRARDIRRRIEVIQKKLSDLQELDIPCAFCYSSVRNTGSLFTLGDRRITDVVERHKNEILKNLIENKRDSTTERNQEIHLILPPLPGPLAQLSRATMQSLIVGILKDLGIRWSDPKPQWWPMDIPFYSPRSMPDNFKGNWTQALRKVIESVYSFFSYDVGTYVAGNLEIDDPIEEDGGGRAGGGGGGGEDETETTHTEEKEESVEEAQQKIKQEQEEEGEDERESLAQEDRNLNQPIEEGGEEGGGEEEGGEEEEGEGREGGVEEEEETDEAMSPEEYDTSTEEDAFEDSPNPELIHNNHSSNSLVQVKQEHLKNTIRGGRNHKIHSHSVSGYSHHSVPSPSRVVIESSLSSSSSSSSNTGHNKHISSFTVENILMGSTSRSNSTSSSSPNSASHSSSHSFLPFSLTGSSSSSSLSHATFGLPQNSSSGGGVGGGVGVAIGSNPASPSATSGNWTSHPPVKYTKFTMISPSTMKVGGDKRRKGERDKTVTTLDTHSHLKISGEDSSSAGGYRGSKRTNEDYPTSSLSVNHSSATTGHQQLTYHHSVIQKSSASSSSSSSSTTLASSTTAITSGGSLSRQNSTHSVAMPSPRLVPVSPNPFQQSGRVPGHSPHPTQQYVVFFPTNMAVMAAAPSADFQVLGQISSSSSSPTFTQLPSNNTTGATLVSTGYQQSNGNHKKTTAGHKFSSSSPSPPHPSTSTTGSLSLANLSVPNSSKNLRIFRTSSNPSYTSTHKMSSDGQLLLQHSDKNHFTSVHKMGPNSLLVPADKGETRGRGGGGGGKGGTKQKKLRFHMTTVVKKPRRRSSSVSLTAPPPSLCNRTINNNNSRTTTRDEKEREVIAVETNQANKLITTPLVKQIDTCTKSVHDHANHTSSADISPANISSTSATTSSSTSSTHTITSSPSIRPPHSSHSSNSSPDRTTDKNSFPNALATPPARNSLTPPPPPPPLSHTSSASSIDSTGDPSELEQVVSNNGRGKGRGRSRRARGYTRRKRELTFHLYEDPYSAKRLRQQN